MNLHSIETARQKGVQRYLYTWSACIYPGYKQNEMDINPLKEEDARIPPTPKMCYGWEKLYMKRGCRHYSEDLSLD